MKRWLCLGLLCLGAGGAAAESRALIVCGSGGEEKYSRRLQDWGLRLQEVLVQQPDFAADGVVLLTEDGTGDGVSDLAQVEAALEALDGTLEATGQLYVFLIGHGNFRRQTAKFHLPGIDLSAPDLGRLLERGKAGRVGVVNSASASASFIEALSGPQRVICTSTAQPQERNATFFMEFFITGLEDGSADRNRDGRIALGEACRQAAELTGDWYTQQGRLASEHALLDDNGDGRGTPLAAGADGGGKDGQLAGQLFLRDWAFAAGADPALIAAYRAAIARVETHIATADTAAGSTASFRRLEELLLQAARINRRLQGEAGVVNTIKH